MQERDRTHRAGGGDEDLTRILLMMMMMMDMKILMERLMRMIMECTSGTGRDVEDYNSERADDHYDDGDGDGDDNYVGFNEKDNVDEGEMCKSKRGHAVLANIISMRMMMVFMMLKRVRIILEGNFSLDYFPEDGKNKIG